MSPSLQTVYLYISSQCRLGLKRPMGVTGEAPLILPWTYLCSRSFVRGCPFMEDTTPFSIPVG